ncbi:MAG: CRISPR system precrRNA processing endoribonuclease RAMP protein Cas6 [Dysgonamonadaceae bacterium]|jgi:hypothetical protein|nr:CRISPR system precrRNA processing endoribonuclease RAMP protein Cas6 [Dysgonamonadaceae bacterium]
MNDFLIPYHDLCYHRLDVRITAVKDTIFDAWPGAIIRNNLLFASEQIPVGGEMSLREKINRIPLLSSHPLYKDLAGGFPRGYQVTLQSNHDMTSSVFLRKNEILCFSVILIGDMAQYFNYFIRAIRLMCQRGFGYPMVPFLLIDVNERSYSGECQLLATEQSGLSDRLQYPVRLSDFYPNQPKGNKKSLKIMFETPVSLFKQTKKKDTKISYQDKTNGFPSFYQLVRSMVFRLQKLHTLYVDPDNYFDSEEQIEDYLNHARECSLLAADIRKIVLQSTPKKETEDRIQFGGYIGELSFDGDFSGYIPLLRFMQELGVGDGVVYGMGRFRTNIK